MKDNAQNNVRVEYMSEYINNLLGVARGLTVCNCDKQTSTGRLVEQVLFNCKILSSEFNHFCSGVENSMLEGRQDDQEKFESLLEYVADLTVRPLHKKMHIDTVCVNKSRETMDKYLQLYYNIYCEFYAPYLADNLLYRGSVQPNEIPE